MRHRISLLAVLLHTAFSAKAQHAELCRFVYAKHKHGRAQEAIGIRLKIFLPAYDMNDARPALGMPRSL